MKRLLSICLVILLTLNLGAVLFMAQPAQSAGDWQVYPGGSIQAAIDAAAAAGGGTVNVAPGMYFEAITLRSGVEVRGTAGITVIDGTDLGYSPMVTASGVDDTAVLSGFVIINASSNGMENSNSSPTVTDTTFMASRYSGMVNTNSSPTVTNCLFYDNQGADWGGGMVNFTSSPTVINSTFQDNRGGIFGGGMGNWYGASPTVINSLFYGNSAGDSGGGMSNEESSVTVINSLFYDNSAHSGGGMSNSLGSLTVINSVFYGNTAGDRGGGMTTSGDSLTVTNSIFYGNTAPAGKEIFNSGTGSANVTYSDVEGGYSGTGNIDADPLFANPDGGDFHLLVGKSLLYIT